MSHSFLSLFIFSVFIICSVRSDGNSLLDALKDVQTDVDELIAPADRVRLNNEFYDNDWLKGLNFGKLFGDLNSGTHDNQTCHICNNVFRYGKMLLQTNALVRAVAKSVCKTANFYSERVCNGMLERMGDPVVYILQHTKLTEAEICAVLLHPDCMTHMELPFTHNVDWTIEIPKPKPFKPLARNGSSLKMLHLSDFHLDLWYTPDSNAMCEEPICCRSTSHGHNRSAGFWSERYRNCDTPVQLADNAIQHIKDTHKDIDLVVWTGDNVPHDVWNTSIATNLLHIKTISDLVANAFDGKTVLPSLGNHESHPINMYIPHEVSVATSGNFSNSWLYDTLADNYWSKWINTDKAKKSFKKGGYYSVLVKGLKAIVLNDNICQRGNYWMAYDPVDPDGQLKWLVEELDEAETNGRYVMIIGHLSPTDCYYAWSKNYYRIAERYEHLIVGAYFGHTHKDEIIVFYNKNTTTNQLYPIGHGYIGPSITTYTSLNPGYKIYTLDAIGKPLDFEMYYTNVTLDNIKGSKVSPEWELGYSAKKSYGLTDLSTKSWDDFITRAKTDDKLTELYFKHYHKFSETFEDELRKDNNLNIGYKRNTLQDQREVNPSHSLLKHN